MNDIETFKEFCKNNTCSICRFKEIAIDTGCSNCEKHFMKEHDAQIRADAIEEYRKEMHDMIEGNEEFTDWQKYEILECNELVAEQLKEQNK